MSFCSFKGHFHFFFCKCPGFYPFFSWVISLLFFFLIFMSSLGVKAIGFLNVATFPPVRLFFSPQLFIFFPPVIYFLIFFFWLSLWCFWLCKRFYWLIYFYIDGIFLKSCFWILEHGKILSIALERCAICSPFLKFMFLNFGSIFLNVDLLLFIHISMYLFI